MTNKLIKSKKIIKCIYHSSKFYELRYIINNKIDRNMSIGEDNFNVWKLSYITYKNKIINHNKYKTNGSRRLTGDNDENIEINNLNI